MLFLFNVRAIISEPSEELNQILCGYTVGIGADASSMRLCSVMTYRFHLRLFFKVNSLSLVLFFFGWDKRELLELPFLRGERLSGSSGMERRRFFIISLNSSSDTPVSFRRSIRFLRRSMRSASSRRRLFPIQTARAVPRRAITAAAAVKMRIGVTEKPSDKAPPVGFSSGVFWDCSPEDKVFWSG